MVQPKIRGVGKMESVPRAKLDEVAIRDSDAFKEAKQDPVLTSL